MTSDEEPEKEFVSLLEPDGSESVRRVDNATASSWYHTDTGLKPQDLESSV